MPATKTNEENIEYIRINTQRIAEALESIARALTDEKGNSQVKFLNWNLGKLVAISGKDKKTYQQIVDEEKKSVKKE